MRESKSTRFSKNELPSVRCRKRQPVHSSSAAKMRKQAVLALRLQRTARRGLALT